MKKTLKRKQSVVPYRSKDNETFHKEKVIYICECFKTSRTKGLKKKCIDDFIKNSRKTSFTPSSGNCFSSGKLIISCPDGNCSDQVKQLHRLT